MLALIMIFKFTLLLIHSTAIYDLKLLVAINMEFQLTAVSPLSFMMTKEGDVLRIEHKPPKPNEFREKIGPAAEFYLVFKGRTKIGMIPQKIATQHKELMKKKYCRIEKIDKIKSIIIVVLKERKTA